ncbi:16S rRNA (guanine(966)-N(2))-methyltransferase RsmD [Salinicola acroporae]|uniref:16S rRNA (guanine(966)-N(2))-methyltransferase RsmD n=1 Tax=Salinicola acroporae TaxID=1541440 RepID=UPI0031BA567F
MNRRRPRRVSDSARSRQPSQATARGGRGQLRLIGGEFRRRKLSIPDSPGLRPTPDRVRETLFNWLAFDIAGRQVLDLYAGTGALGLEALSRGAAQTTFVESTAPVAKALEANIAMLGAAGDVVGIPVERFLATTPNRFDLVFLDPLSARGLPRRPASTSNWAVGWRPTRSSMSRRNTSSSGPRRRLGNYIAKSWRETVMGGFSDVNPMPADVATSRRLSPASAPRRLRPSNQRPCLGNESRTFKESRDEW